MKIIISFIFCLLVKNLQAEDLGSYLTEKYGYQKFNLIDIKEAIAKFDVIALLVKHKEFTSQVVLSELERKGALNFVAHSFLQAFRPEQYP